MIYVGHIFCFEVAFYRCVCSYSGVRYSIKNNDTQQVEDRKFSAKNLWEVAKILLSFLAENRWKKAQSLEIEKTHPNSFRSDFKIARIDVFMM